MRRINAGVAWIAAILAMLPRPSNALEECSQLGAASLPQCVAQFGNKDASVKEGMELMPAAFRDEIAHRDDDAISKYQRARDLLSVDAANPKIAVLLVIIEKQIDKLRSVDGEAAGKTKADPRTGKQTGAKAETRAEVDPLEPEPRSSTIRLADGSEVIYSPYVNLPCEVYLNGAPSRSCDFELQARARHLFSEQYDSWQSCLWAKGKMRPASLSGEFPNGDIRKCKNPQSAQETRTAQLPQSTPPAQPTNGTTDVSNSVAAVAQGLAAGLAGQGQSPAAQQVQQQVGKPIASVVGAGKISNTPQVDIDSSRSTISGAGMGFTPGRAGTSQGGIAPQTNSLQPVSAAHSSPPEPTCVKDPSWTGWIKRTGSDGNELTFFGEERRCEITATGASCNPAQANLMFIEWSGVLKKQTTRSSPCKSLDQVAANMVDARLLSKVSFEMRGDCVRDPDFTNEVTDAYGSSGGLLYNSTTTTCIELSSGRTCDAPRLTHMEARWNIKVAAAKAKYPACDAGYRPRSSMPQQVSAPVVPASRSLFAQPLSGASTAPRRPVAKVNVAKIKQTPARVAARARPTRVRSVTPYDDDPAPSDSGSSSGYDGPSAGDVVSGLFSVVGAVLPVAAALAGGRVRTTPSYSAPRTVYRPPPTSYPAGPGPSRSGISGLR